MGRVLIISDTHFLRLNEITSFINQFNDLDAILHCGDIYPGFNTKDLKHVYICKGNNDYAPLPRIAYFMVNETQFMMTHGHLNNFAYNPQSLIDLTKDFPADVICFGHTHKPYFYQDDHLTIINPGSLVLSRTYPKVNTYVIYDTDSRKVVFYDAKTHEEYQVKNEFIK